MTHVVPRALTIFFCIIVVNLGAWVPLGLVKSFRSALFFGTPFGTNTVSGLGIVISISFLYWLYWVYEPRAKAARRAERRRRNRDLSVEEQRRAEEYDSSDEEDPPC
jgi:cbb3-type cytochrome oxidase subunit 3